MAFLGFDVLEKQLGKTKAYGLLAVVVSTFIYSIKRAFANHVLESFLEEQPCPGRSKSPLSWTRATIRSVMGTPQMVAEGYEKYARKGLPFVIPSIRKGAYLVIPPAHFRAVLSKPESVVEAHAPQFENVSAAYTMRDPDIYPSNYDVDIVKKQITKKFGSIARDLAEEIALAFDEHWGTSSDWKEVKAWLSLQDIAARAMNRVMVGLPLCRNEALLKNVIKYSMSVPEAGIGINILPSFLQPLLGPLIAKKGTNHCEAAIKIYLPLVEQRLNQYHSDQKASGGWSPPNDMLQWLIEESAANSNPDQMQPRRIAHRLVMLNFNAVPPTGLTLSNVLFDLFSAPPDRGFVEQLRKEANQALKQDPEGYWTKDAVSKLHLIDSTIRESMRHSDFGSTAFPRRVAASSGIDIGGIRVPRGTHMEIPMHAIHMDSDLYPNPTLFEPFRFAPKEVLPSDAGPHAGEKPQPLITIEENFLGFGYGRSGCPGRFFASHMMKVMFAYIVQNYDVEYMEARPKMIELMEFRFPNENSTIRVRRRT